MTDNNRIDAATFLTILRRRWWAILGTAALAAALALALSLAQPTSYQASAYLLFQKDDLDRTLLGLPGEDTQLAPERIAATNLELASLEAVTAKVHDRLGGRLSVEQLRERVQIAPKGQADIITVTASGPTRRAAVDVANAFAAEIAAFRRRVAQERVQRAINALRLAQREGADSEQQSAQQDEVAPQRRIEQLTAIKATQQGDVDVIQWATPPKDRAAPKPLRNTVIGGVLGLILGVFVALVLNKLDRRVRDDEEIATLVGAPVLTRVPLGRRSRQQNVVEALQFLRTNLQLTEASARTRVIAVTSPLEGDGKTTIAAGLAEVLAHSGQNVIAVDCDLRSPALHEQLGLERSAGVRDALVDLRDPEDLLQEASPGLRVLTAGVTTLDAFAVVLALQRLPDLLARLREIADYVIVDTSPISVAADASTVVAAVDDVLLVVDPNRARRDVLSAVHDQLQHIRAHILGVVINRAPAPLLGASYGSYWGPDEELSASLSDLAPPGSPRS